MKLRFFIFAVVISFLLALASPTLAAPKVIVDGRQLSFDVPPIIQEGRVLVPMRAIFEALGAEIDWDSITRTVTATRGETTLALTVGSHEGVRNGARFTLDVPARIINDRTLVPLRFVSYCFDAYVNWDGTTQTVTIVNASRDIRVHFIDVGQGDAIYISLPGQNDILIDGGDNAYGPTVVNYLRNESVDDIELLIATHPHADHIGGLDDVLAAFKVEAVVDNGIPHNTATYRDYWAAVQSEGCKYEKAGGQWWVFGDVKISILAPVRTFSDVNNNSVVVLLDYEDIQILFMGDAETEEEASIIDKLSDIEILKVGHHGSATSTTATFLKKVQPEHAVISVGAGNQYGHPAASTLQRLSYIGTTVHRTDIEGTAIAVANGKEYYVISKQEIVSNYVKPIPPTSQPVSPSSTGGKYVGSAKSDKFHLPSCRYAQQIAPDNRVWFNSEAEAQAAGYVACKVCGG